MRHSALNPRLLSTRNNDGAKMQDGHLPSERDGQRAGREVKLQQALFAGNLDFWMRERWKIPQCGP